MHEGAVWVAPREAEVLGTVAAIQEPESVFCLSPAFQNSFDPHVGLQYLAPHSTDAEVYSCHSLP